MADYRKQASGGQGNGDIKKIVVKTECISHLFDLRLTIAKASTNPLFFTKIFACLPNAAFLENKCSGKSCKQAIEKAISVLSKFSIKQFHATGEYDA
ncbi:MAG: hypothetical protein B6240_02690 [Desulfobacteraceae bacterium 4572_87]|nr:MAG: hypothetical protein B6240_02690 [Desulfobacteraceae bacterium 4572_87]